MNKPDNSDMNNYNSEFSNSLNPDNENNVNQGLTTDKSQLPANEPEQEYAAPVQQAPYAPVPPPMPPQQAPYGYVPPQAINYPQQPVQSYLKQPQSFYDQGQPQQYPPAQQGYMYPQQNPYNNYPPQMQGHPKKSYIQGFILAIIAMFTTAIPILGFFVALAAVILCHKISKAMKSDPYASSSDSTLNVVGMVFAYIFLSVGFLISGLWGLGTFLNAVGFH